MHILRNGHNHWKDSKVQLLYLIESLIADQVREEPLDSWYSKNVMILPQIVNVKLSHLNQVSICPLMFTLVPKF